MRHLRGTKNDRALFPKRVFFFTSVAVSVLCVSTQLVAVMQSSVWAEGKEKNVRGLPYTSTCSLRAAGVGEMLSSACLTVCDTKLRGNKCAMCCAVLTCGV